MMVSADNLVKLSSYLKQKNIDFSYLMADVEKAVDEENLAHAGTVFSSYSGFDYGRYHNLNEVWFRNVF